MFYINKNSIMITLIIIFILIISSIYNLNNNKSTIQTVSLPVSGKTIVLDAGHGQPDEGGCFIEVSGM